MAHVFGRNYAFDSIRFLFIVALRRKATFSAHQTVSNLTKPQRVVSVLVTFQVKREGLFCVVEAIVSPPPVAAFEFGALWRSSFSDVLSGGNSSFVAECVRIKCVPKSFEAAK